MENASKALIIAGAILLAILIIGLGMLIFNQASDTVGKANLDQETITAFNSKFDKYVGDNVNGSNVKQLLALVRDNNLNSNGSTIYGIGIDATNSGATNNKTINVSENDSEANIANTAANINDLRNQISSGKTYKVTVEYSKTTKLINKFKIEKKS